MGNQSNQPPCHSLSRILRHAAGKASRRISTPPNVKKSLRCRTRKPPNGTLRATHPKHEIGHLAAMGKKAFEYVGEHKISLLFIALVPHQGLVATKVQFYLKRLLAARIFSYYKRSRQEQNPTYKQNMQAVSEDSSKQPKSVDGKNSTGVESTKSPAAPAKKGFRFWTIIAAIGFASILTSLEATITSTVLPSIVADLGGGDLYIWVINGYFLAMTTLQPVFGQLANVFGRRYPLIICTALFTLGSGICGGANSIGMLIGGRVIQGMGASGIGVLVEIIICDLVPLRERGKYLAIVLGIVAFGTALGPFFGGLIIDHTTWRWVFYLNLPIGGTALVLLALFLQVNYDKDSSLSIRLTKIDWCGNLIFVASVSSLLIALSWAGSVYPWSSFRAIVPLVLGAVGLIVFTFFEASRWAPQPMIPLHLFSNRTSASAFGLSFVHSILTMWTLYFLPVYFQGVLGSSPGYSGVQLLPTILALIPAAGLVGIVMSKLGRYRPIHHLGYAIMTISFGLFSLLNAGSSTGAWVGYQVVGAIGTGLLIPTLLPAVMAPLTDADTAQAAATWAFLRSFGITWGTAIPAAIFNTRFDELAPQRITNPALVAELAGGEAYQHATSAFLSTLPTETRDQFISVLVDSLQRSWLVAVGFAGLAFLLVIIEKEIPLRQELETEFGIAGKKTKEAGSGEQA
ncbi:major facilitator superfamily protein [Xylariaceae sp. FL0662B]|nr:major facilitator superfamily protein [Xylariaceae sp. FL0662B]